MTVYPYYVKAFAEDADTRRNFLFHRSPPRTRWLLNVAGPFCMIARGPAIAYALPLADRASDLLALPVHPRCDGRTIHLDVVITDELKDRLIRQEYAKQTEERSK
jgi:hypothetical protein